jgi:hypothetical protein
MSSICNEVDKMLKENDAILKEAARRSHMTVEELEDSYWADEAAAREKVNAFFMARGLAPVEWRFGMNAQLMLLKLSPEKKKEPLRTSVKPNYVQTNKD